MEHHQLAVLLETIRQLNDQISLSKGGKRVNLELRVKMLKQRIEQLGRKGNLSLVLITIPPKGDNAEYDEVVFYHDLDEASIRAMVMRDFSYLEYSAINIISIPLGLRVEFSPLNKF